MERVSVMGDSAALWQYLCCMELYGNALSGIVSQKWDAPIAVVSSPMQQPMMRAMEQTQAPMFLRGANPEGQLVRPRAQL